MKNTNINLNKSELEYNCEVINNHIGYGYPEEAEIYIFAIEEAGNSGQSDLLWKEKFEKVYKTKFENILGPYWLGDEDFLNSYFIDYDDKYDLYYRYITIYNSLFRTKILKKDLGTSNAKKLFIGNIYPISKPNTRVQQYSKVDFELFGFSDYHKWKESCWELRKQILKEFFMKISITNRKIKLCTFSQKKDKDECKALFCEIFNINNNIEPKTFSSRRTNSDNKYYSYQYNNITVFNCDSLSNSWVTNDQLEEIGLFVKEK